MADENKKPQLQRTPSMRDRKPSMSAPITDLQGQVGPGFTRPKHKRTVTGFGANEIKAVEASIPEPQRAA
jgi:starch phosphorylase